MRNFVISLLFFVAASAGAAEKVNQLFGCSINIPDTTGWQDIEAQSSPAITILWAAQHSQRQASFGVNVLHNLPGKSLRDAGNIAAIEDLLKSMGYQPIGHSIITVAQRGWLQFHVRGSNAGQPMNGIVRYTLANDHVFGISMLSGGGRDASQDTEMQAAATSFRVLPTASAALANPPTVPGAAPGTPGAAPAAPGTPAEPSASTEPELIAGYPAHYVRIALMALGGLIVIMILVKIIGGGNDQGPPTKPPARRL